MIFLVPWTESNTVLLCFVDLCKAFDSVDHDLLLDRLQNIGLSDEAVQWFTNYLADRSQCVFADGHKSDFLEITKGVPQGSILAPILFSIFINDFGKDMHTAKLHLYADDTVIYSVASSVNQAIDDLQTAFKQLQTALFGLKLVLNPNKRLKAT